MGKKKRRKMFDSPEERDAFMARWEENTRRLEARLEKLTAELAARGQKPRGLEYWLERHEAERAAREQPST
jgi:hypothetical protein